ncbi:MAG: Asp/Glu racemase, partial [Rhodospirillaceae bacterium]|nr:Asp/Glu racemase [Rhodospirillaceae bacterium]
MSKNVTIDWQLEDAASGPRVIGLIALSSDLTLERDVSRMVPAGQVAVYVNRIHNQNPMTLENLAAMQNDMAEAAAGILPESRLDAIAYGCTSGTVAIGPQKVIDIISGARPGVAVTTPITAAL